MYAFLVTAAFVLLVGLLQGCGCNAGNAATAAGFGWLIGIFWVAVALFVGWGRGRERKQHKPPTATQQPRPRRESRASK